MELQSHKSTAPGSQLASPQQTSSKLERLAQRWLSIQCEMIKDVLSAQLVCCDLRQETLQCLANWPKVVPEHNAIGQELLHCLKTNKYLLVEAQCDHNGDINRLAYPLLKTEHFHYVAMLDLRPRSELMLRSVINMLQWGERWFRFAYIQPEQRASIAHMALWDGASRCLEQKDFRAAINSLVGQLATTLRCSRVSFGRWQRQKMRVMALSHTSTFNEKTDAIRRLARAMTEAVEQDAIVQIPEQCSSSAELSAHAHKRLCDSSLNGSLCSIPLSIDGEIFAVVTLERELERPFSEAEIQYAEHLMSLLAVNLKALGRQSDNTVFRILARLEQLKSKLSGSGSGGLKLKLGAVALVLLFLVFADGTYKITSPAVVEGRIQRAIVAPQDGFLATANVRAGDLVKTDQPMGSLENKDLKLEQLSISSEQQELLSEYREAQAEHDNAEVGVVAAKIEQANARMQLVNEKLKRTQLLAPFDGLVIEGDLSQSLGSPVTKGDVLFKVAPLEDYRIMIQVDESDIASITPGLEGVVALTSLPGKKTQVRVEQITSVSTAEDSSNYFRVEASLLEANQMLRPGMEGAAKIELGERSLVWIWTHKMVNWIKLKTWVWLP